ncbi:MAG: hypothetical protein Q7J86_04425, partial [Bacteroidota bacterium]|nr:hypothetical protein [Bacteroidota bacterium]
MRLKHLIYIFPLTLLFLVSFPINSDASDSIKTAQQEQSVRTDLRLKHKIVPLSNQIYQILDYFET